MCKEFFTYMWLEIWNSLHTSNTRWLACCSLHILAKKSMEELNHLVHHIHIGQRIFQGINRDSVFYIFPFNCYNLNFQRVVHPLRQLISPQTATIMEHIVHNSTQVMLGIVVHMPSSCSNYRIMLTCSVVSRWVFFFCLFEQVSSCTMSFVIITIIVYSNVMSTFCN